MLKVLPKFQQQILPKLLPQSLPKFLTQLLLIFLAKVLLTLLLLLFLLSGRRRLPSCSARGVGPGISSWPPRERSPRDFRLALRPRRAASSQ